MNLLLLIKKLRDNKKAAMIILFSIAIAVIYLTIQSKFRSILEKEYLRGVEETKQLYLVELDKANKQYSEQLELALKSHKKVLKANFDLEVQRIKEGVKTDVRVETITKTVIKELPIKAECNSVPDDFRRVYNNFINSINSTETGS